MGFIQLNIPVFESGNEIDFLRNVFLHEIMHILAFSRPLFDFFPFQFISLEQDKYVIKHGSFLSAFKDHINCPVVDSIPIENQIQNGCHLEKSLFGNELMTPNITSKSVLSNFTLLFLQDTGWYQVFIDQAERLHWGANKKCEFLND